MRTKLQLALLIAGITTAWGSALDEANQRFAAGDFPAAIEAYEKIIESQGPDAAVYYNLGNSHQSLKQYGPAILAYERARLLTPRDPDLLANLTLARKAATAFEEPELNPQLDTVLQYFSRNEWSWLVAGAALVLGFTGLLYGIFKMRRLAGIAAGCAAFVIAAGSGALYLRRAEASRGVVLTEQAVVRLSPFTTAESLGNVGAGRMVRVGEAKAGFHYVEIPKTNLRGWLSSADAASIIPDKPQR